MIPRASVLVPIHNKPSTLPLTVDTVLRQSEPELEVLLIGDGVTDAVREVVDTLTSTDGRVRFLDFPKGPHHGERYRHEAIRAARSDAIFYVCDDDLLLPDHVADLLGLLEEHTFVQSLNGEVRPDGHVRFYAADLGDPDVVALHLRDDIRFCSVSITGTAHTRALYDAVVDPWDTTPEGWWPDHWQFRKLMAHPAYRGATSDRMTALQFPTSSDGRDTWSDDERLAELEPWHRLVTSPGGQEDVDRRCEQGRREQLVEDRATISLLQHDLEWLREEHATQQTGLAWLQEKYDEQHEQLGWVREQYEIQLRDVAYLREQYDTARGTIAKVRERLARKSDLVDKLRAERRARKDPSA